MPVHFQRVIRKLVTGLLLLGISIFSVQGQRFYPDDPIWEDPDDLPVEMPRERDVSQIADFLLSTFVRRPEGRISPAVNTNTLGEVPNSSWFTNRIGMKEMTLEEVVKGPNQLDGPELPLTITSAKLEGITPGFFTKDSRGDSYLIKFDPKGYPQMATSAEVVVTKFFHAFGYHVPENYLSYIEPADLLIGPEAEIEELDGSSRKMTRDDLEEILDKAPMRPDGRIQVVASRLVDGEPLGPFKYYGTRKDDPNDIFPHQDRRELRGMRVFASWLNHDDSRSINSLDVYVGEDPEGHVQHYLIDFGSTLGSGSVKPQSRRAGNEYIIEWPPIFKAALSLGIWDRDWRSVDYPDYPSVGRFEGDFFDPALWRPEYPNPAFERMQPEDALWATRIVLKFTDEMIRALVEKGEYVDEGAESHIVQTLIKRRDKIIGYYLGQISPIVDFHLQGGGHLAFSNLGIDRGIGDQASYNYQWFEFDNNAQTLNPLEMSGAVNTPLIPLPSRNHSYLMVRIRTESPGQPAWSEPVDVYIRLLPEREVVGISRGFSETTPDRLPEVKIQP